MRAAFIQTLIEIAGRDDRIWLLTGDLGYSVIEPFVALFPQRYVNAGVAEQNMIGLAAGLALTGKTVFVYSIANFPTLRCLEQIRNDVCGHNLSVKVVAVGGGFSYGALGYSHHGIEDLAILRALPRMEVAAPADPVETRLITGLMAESGGPAYLRLGKNREPVLHATAPALKRGHPLAVRAGEKVAILATGGILEPCLKAAGTPCAMGKHPAVYSVPWLKPMDRQSIAAVARRFTHIVTVEEAQVCGGLGGAVAEILAELPAPHARLTRLGVPDIILENAFSQAAAREKVGITADAIAATIAALA
ncbi:MAG: transketolase C-terminal domain-containing protein [bacterium]